MTTILRIYTDGGVAKKNPSALGGSYCAIAVKETLKDDLSVDIHEISTQSDALFPDELDASKKEAAKGTVSNNNTELMGVITALEMIPKLIEWVSSDLLETLTIVTDSQLAMNWAKGLYSTDSVPKVLLDRLKDAYVHIGSLGFDTQFFPKYELIAGHPSKDDLVDQVKFKGSRKYRVSAVNVKCDKICEKICNAISAIYDSGKDVTRAAISEYMNKSSDMQKELEPDPIRPEMTGYGLKAGNVYTNFQGEWIEVCEGMPISASEFQAFVSSMQRSELGTVGLRASYALGLAGEAAETLEALVQSGWSGAQDEIGDVAHYIFGSAYLLGIDGDKLMLSVIGRIVDIEQGNRPPMPHTLADMAYTLPFLAAKYGELVKKMDYHSKDIDEAKFFSALHNILFSLCGICNATHMTLQAAMTRNMAKLRERHPGGTFTPVYHDQAEAQKG